MPENNFSNAKFSGENRGRGVMDNGVNHIDYRQRDHHQFNQFSNAKFDGDNNGGGTMNNGVNHIGRGGTAVAGDTQNNFSNATFSGTNNRSTMHNGVNMAKPQNLVNNFSMAAFGGTKVTKNNHADTHSSMPGKESNNFSNARFEGDNRSGNMFNGVNTGVIMERKGDRSYDPSPPPSSTPNHQFKKRFDGDGNMYSGVNNRPTGNMGPTERNADAKCDQYHEYKGLRWSGWEFAINNVDVNNAAAPHIVSLSAELYLRSQRAVAV
uniref:Uncharacterized protein n=1 Tax=Moniliophthora roreri TaxID=221103 RepID=A0A0W0EVL8_MONRR